MIKKIYTGKLMHRLEKLQSVRTVKAVRAHNYFNAMHQYVLTNLSLRDAIRSGQEQPLIGWRECRLTAEERRAALKISFVRKIGTQLCLFS